MRQGKIGNSNKIMSISIVVVFIFALMSTEATHVTFIYPYTRMHVHNDFILQQNSATLHCSNALSCLLCNSIEELVLRVCWNISEYAGSTAITLEIRMHARVTVVVMCV